MSRGRALGLLVLGAALALALARATGGRDEWRAHQQRWNQLARAAGRPDAVVRVALRGRARATPERCVSCHLGAVLTPPPAARAPLAAHAELECALAPASGCVQCHRGDGLRTDAGGAHGGGGVAARRVLDLRAHPRSREERLRLLQPACARCHERRAPSGALRYDEAIVPEVARGLRLYLAQGCHACHRLRGVMGASAGAPALDGVGNRRGPVELHRLLRSPQRESPRSPMPPSSLPDAELERLVAFLAAQGGARAPAPVAPLRLVDHFELSAPAGAAAGARWARELGCLGCHRLGEADSGVPDLRLVAWYASSEDLLRALREPERRFPGTHMPRLEAPEQLTASLLEWLALQRVPLPSTPAAVVRSLCTRCHGPERDPGAVVLARRPPVLDRRVPRERFIEAVMNGRKGSAMAPWGRAFGRAFVETLHRELAR